MTISLCKSISRNFEWSQPVPPCGGLTALTGRTSSPFLLRPAEGFRRNLKKTAITSILSRRVPRLRMICERPFTLIKYCKKCLQIVPTLWPNVWQTLDKFVQRRNLQPRSEAQPRTNRKANSVPAVITSCRDAAAYWSLGEQRDSGSVDFWQ